MKCNALMKFKETPFFDNCDENKMNEQLSKKLLFLKFMKCNVLLNFNETSFFKV
jgi:hypothetical protein